MKTSFTEKIVVKAAIVVPTKRYVQAASGNSGILEFASIKDAVEVKAMFHAKTILGYENSTAEWLADGCEKPRPKQIYCNCMGCEGEAPEVPFLIDAQPWKRS
ncbi:hypothetical protein MMC19_002551 [Ptychographa xylographoides]|nr:hypothetical protein [Ptychographa xylographoides]